MDRMQASLFRRKYLRVKDVYRKLAQDESIQISLKFNKDEGSSSSLRLSNRDLLVRLSNLMREFLSPRSRLYYKSVWTSLKTLHADQIPVDWMTAIDDAARKLATGAILFSVNGRQLSAEEVYGVVAEGYYFDQREQQRTFLSEVQQQPLAGQLFWFTFHSYTAQAVQVLSVLFDCMKLVEQASGAKDTPVAADDQRTPACIFCKQSDGRFKSEEHIFPESLGNETLILPRGIVCDRCNNTVLARVDEALLDSPPISFLRVLFAPHNKEGKLPQGTFKNATIKKELPTHLKIESLDEKEPAVHERRDDAGNVIGFTLTLTDHALSESNLGRGLYKIALELVAYNFGADYVLRNTFDAARSFVFSGGQFSNNLLLLSGMEQPQGILVGKWREDLPGTIFELYIYGAHFILNLEENPRLGSSSMPAEYPATCISLDGTPW